MPTMSYEQQRKKRWQVRLREGGEGHGGAKRGGAKGQGRGMAAVGSRKVERGGVLRGRDECVTGRKHQNIYL